MKILTIKIYLAVLFICITNLLLSFHRAHAILHPAEHLPLEIGHGRDRDYHDAHLRYYLDERSRKSQA